MILEYKNIQKGGTCQTQAHFEDGGKTIVQADGTTVSLMKWLLYSYKVIELSNDEKPLREIWRSTPRGRGCK